MASRPALGLHILLHAGAGRGRTVPNPEPTCIDSHNIGWMDQSVLHFPARSSVRYFSFVNDSCPLPCAMVVLVTPHEHN